MWAHGIGLVLLTCLACMCLNIIEYFTFLIGLICTRWKVEEKKKLKHFTKHILSFICRRFCETLMFTQLLIILIPALRLSYRLRPNNNDWIISFPIIVDHQSNDQYKFIIMRSWWWRACAHLAKIKIKHHFHIKERSLNMYKQHTMPNFT